MRHLQQESAAMKEELQTQTFNRDHIGAANAITQTELRNKIQERESYLEWQRTYFFPEEDFFEEYKKRTQN